LGLERRRSPRARDRARVPRVRGHRRAHGVSRRHERYGPRRMALRDGRGARLRRAALGRPGLVALVCALYLGAGVVATWPALQHAGSHFLARATTLSGEASAGDHLQAEYHLWLVGHQLEHGRAPWRDPYTFQPESTPRTNFGGWPFGLPFWPLSAAFGEVLG